MIKIYKKKVKKKRWELRLLFIHRNELQPKPVTSWSVRTILEEYLSGDRDEDGSD